MSQCGSTTLEQLPRVGQNPVALNNLNALQLCDVNPDRIELMIQNVGLVIVYIGFGFAPSATNYSVALMPCQAAIHDASGAMLITDAFKGAIYAIGAGVGALIAVSSMVAS